MQLPFDWDQGLWQSQCENRVENRPGICLGIAGDWAPIRAFAPLLEADPKAIYGDLLPHLLNQDLSLVNLEAPLSDKGEGVVKSGAVFKGVTAHVDGLKAAEFNAVTLANNHVFDFGQEAFDQTVETLDRAGIAHTGAGETLPRASAPLILEKQGIRIAVLNFSEGEDLTAAGPQAPGVVGWELDLMEEEIRELKGKVHAIVVIAHCGIEYVPFPPAYVGDAFRRMAHAGADLVVGHHPHVPQGMEVHNGVPIFYSLGNFVFFQPVDRFYRKQGYWLSCDINAHGIARVRVNAYGISDTGLFTLKGDALNRFRSDFKTVSLPLWEKGGLEKSWHAFLDYYGNRMFKPEVNRLMETLETEPGKGAAMFRNRITTLQHSRLWQDTMTRIIQGKLHTPHQDLKILIHQWLEQGQNPETGGPS